MSLTLTLLGGFEAGLDGVEAGFATNAARALLSYLAAQPGCAFSRGSLAVLLWPDKPKKSANANLRQTIARIRDALGETTGDVVEITPHALRFQSPAADVDVLRFERLIAESRQHAHVDGALCEACVSRLHEAVDLYRGEFLRGLDMNTSDAFEEWLMLCREQYRRQMLEALHALARHYERLNDINRSREFAQRQLDLEPWREEAHAQVMRALASAGQRSAALAQYRECCQMLERDLGIGPSNELRVLFERIQAGEIAPAKLDAGLPRHNLPEQLATFIGREAELAGLARWMQDRASRLITLVGSGGMGKTRLAIEAARIRLDDFCDGVYFVSLASLDTADAIVPAICAAIGCPTPSANLLQAMLKHLAGRHMLLVLDNYEHVMDGAGLVVDILQAAPDVRIIATSREQLNVRGERVFVVHGMDYPRGSDAQAHGSAGGYASVQLFEHTARRTQPGFALSPRNTPAVLRIVALVQGMPLGVELAAAWVGTLTVDEIADEIAKSAGFLETTWRDMPARQRNMRAVFDWSWNLLKADERAALSRASVFRGGFTRAAAGEVASVSLTYLARLIQKSLLAQQDDSRYALHDLLHQFVGERLDEQPDVKRSLLSRHSAWYLAWLAGRERRLLCDEPVAASNEIKAEIDNVRQAWLHACESCNAADLQCAAIVMWQFYANNGLAQEGLQMFEAAMRSATQASTGALFRAVMGALSMVLGRHEAALANSELAITLATAGDNSFAMTLGWLVKGQALRRKGRTPPARDLLNQVIETARAHRAASTDLPERWALLEARSLNWLCSFDTIDANYEAVQRNVALELALGRSYEMRRVIAVALNDRISLAHVMGDWESMRHALDESMRVSWQVGNLNGVANVLRMQSLLARHDGDYDTALARVVKARAQFQDIGDAVGEVYSWLEEGLLRVLMGDFVNARDQLDTAERSLLKLGEPAVEMVLLQHARTWLALHAGDTAQALTLAEEACLNSRVLDMPLHLGDALVLLGLAQEAAGKATEAWHAFASAIKVFDQLALRYRSLEPRAGLARLALDKGDLPAASEIVSELMSKLPAHPHASPILSPRSDDFGTRIWGGADEPFRILLTCHDVLQAGGDARAGEFLRQAQDLLVFCASHISDATLRASYLEQVRMHHRVAYVV